MTTVGHLIPPLLIETKLGRQLRILKENEVETIHLLQVYNSKGTNLLFKGYVENFHVEFAGSQVVIIDYDGNEVLIFGPDEFIIIGKEIA